MQHHITAVQKESHQTTFTKHEKNNLTDDAGSILYFVLLQCIWNLISLHYDWQTIVRVFIILWLNHHYKIIIEIIISIITNIDGGDHTMNIKLND